MDYTTIRFNVKKSARQLALEANRCRFNGQQQRLADHEVDPTKPCKCGRPVKCVGRTADEDKEGL